MKEYKSLQQELIVLESRNLIPGAMPAMFHWMVIMMMIVDDGDDGNDDNSDVDDD